jgi:Holliday junction DNA helicase RuvA
MLYSLRGKLTATADTFCVIECSGVGYKVYASRGTLGGLPVIGSEVLLFTHLFVRDTEIEVYGFLEEGALKLFELLITVAGVGPKTALGILDIDTVPNIMAAILEKRTDVLTRASGIGKKTAERVILELQNRIKLSGTAELTKTMDVNQETLEVLVGLGYSQSDVRRVLDGLPKEVGTIEERLRAALKALGRRNQ